MDQQSIRSTYRHFIRYGLRAINHKAPQKYIIINLLRDRFRSIESLPSSEVVENTKQFILNAALYEGMESRIVNNIVHVEYGRYKLRSKIIASQSNPSKQSKRKQTSQYKRAYNAFDLLIKNLNDSMRLCL